MPVYYQPTPEAELSIIWVKAGAVLHRGRFYNFSKTDWRLEGMGSYACFKEDDWSGPIDFTRGPNGLLMVHNCNSDELYVLHEFD
jgi:hypothetical protein